MASNNKDDGAGSTDYKRVRFGHSSQPFAGNGVNENQEGGLARNTIPRATSGLTRTGSMRALPLKKPTIRRVATPMSDYSSAMEDPDEDQDVSEDTFACQRAGLAGTAGTGHVAFLSHPIAASSMSNSVRIISIAGGPPMLLHPMPGGNAYDSINLMQHAAANNAHQWSEEEYLLNMAMNAKQNVVTVASVKKPTGSTLTSGLDDVHQFPINSKVPTENLMTPNTMEPSVFQWPSLKKSEKVEQIDRLIRLGESFENITYQLGSDLHRDHSILVSHYDTYNSIWLWMIEPGKTREFLSILKTYEECLEKIFSLSLAENSEHHIPLQLEDLVIFKSEKRQLYARGRIYRQRSDQKTALVLLLDYGTIESIALTEMVRQPTEMENLNLTFVWRCKMRDIDYCFTPDDSSFFDTKFAQTMAQENLKGWVIRASHDDWLDVSLCTDKPHSDIGRKLQKYGYQSPLAILGPREHALLTSKPGDMMTLRLVNVEHAGLFHCCPLKTEGTSCALRNIHVTLMNAFKESPEPSTLPEPGNLVAVQHNEQWIRARVLTTGYDATCFLHFVDLGKFGYTPTANIRRLLPDLAEISALSLMCYVKNIECLGVLDGHNPETISATARKMLEDLGMLRADVTLKLEQFHRADKNTLGDSDNDSADVSLTLPDGRDYVVALVDAVKCGKYNS